MATPGRDFYDRQIKFLEEQDVEGLIENQYHPDAILVGFDDLKVQGKADLKTHFREYLDHLGSLKVLSTDKFAELEDAIFFEATVETDIGIAVVYDVFTLKDGKVFRHFTGVKSVQPKE